MIRTIVVWLLFATCAAAATIDFRSQGYLKDGPTNRFSGEHSWRRWEVVDGSMDVLTGALELRSVIDGNGADLLFSVDQMDDRVLKTSRHIVFQEQENTGRLDSEWGAWVGFVGEQMDTESPIVDWMFVQVWDERILPGDGDMWLSVITFDPPVSVPEPSGLVLLLTGIIALRMRK